MALPRDLSRPSYVDRIVIDPEILVGKPVVRGTRVSVELVLEHLAANPDLKELFEVFPHLTLDDVRACLSYAQAVVAGEDVYPTFVNR